MPTGEVGLQNKNNRERAEQLESLYVIVACGRTVELTALCAVAVREERASREGEKHPLVSVWVCGACAPSLARLWEKKWRESKKAGKIKSAEWKCSRVMWQLLCRFAETKGALRKGCTLEWNYAPSTSCVLDGPKNMQFWPRLKLSEMQPALRASRPHSQREIPPLTHVCRAMEWHRWRLFYGRLRKLGC
jgi:hypothetical protein